MDSLILGLDIGTTGLKIALIDINGKTQFAQQHTYQTRFVTSNRIEQNPREWWDAALTAIRNIGWSKRDLFDQITAIAVTGQMQNLILTRNGEPTHPAILYTDMRAVDEAQYVNEVIGADTLRRITGNDQDASSLLAKLLWVKKNVPEALANADRLMIGAHDFVVSKLCGEAVSDVVTASTTGLMTLATRTWATDILDQLGLSNLPLCRLTPGGTEVGRIDTQIAIQLGLPRGLPVFHGPGDAGATTLGAGAGEPGKVYAYLGTSGWIAFTARERGTPEQGVWTLSHPKSDYLIPVAPILTAGGCLEWLREEFKEGRGYNDYIWLAESATTSELLFLPYLSGERAPFRSPNARGVFIGLSRRTKLKDMYRAVLEGVAFAYRHLLDALGVGTPESMVVTGGGTKSQFWMQMFANILNTSIVIPHDSQNIGVQGAALAALVSQNKLNTYAPEHFLQVQTRLNPSPDLRQSYDAYYAVYRDLHHVLSRSFDGMKAASDIRVEELRKAPKAK